MIENFVIDTIKLIIETCFDYYVLGQFYIVLLTVVIHVQFGFLSRTVLQKHFLATDDC